MRKTRRQQIIKRALFINFSMIGASVFFMVGAIKELRTFTSNIQEKNETEISMAEISKINLDLQAEKIYVNSDQYNEDQKRETQKKFFAENGVFYLPPRDDFFDLQDE